MDKAVKNQGSWESEVETASLTSVPQKKPPHRFKPGVSGNPNGRPKGSFSPATRLRNQMALHGERIFNELMQQVESGKAKPRDLIGALQFIVGPLRGELGGTVIPGMAEATTYQEKLDALLTAQTDGSVSPDTAKVIMDTLVKAEEAAQMRQLNEELTSLRARVIDGSARRIA